MKVSVVTPTYNEVGNIEELVTRVHQEFNRLSINDYEHIIIDNNSEDGTFKKCEELYLHFPNLIIIQNERNFGFLKSSYYALTQATGDCVIFLMADLQDPPELIGDMIELWKEGSGIVVCIKTKSKESKIKYALRSVYYKIMKIFTGGDHISHFTGFGLYDKKFIEVLRQCNDSEPYLRGIVHQLGFRMAQIEYIQDKRKSGETKFNYLKLLDYAISGFVNSSNTPLRVTIVMGFLFSFITSILGIIFMIYKLMYWETFQAGVAGIIVAVFFIGSIQIFMLGIIAEYISATFMQVRTRPRIIERRRVSKEVLNDN
jgi:glycosyltransferase involved in cell wall biosynthesis